MLFCPIPSFTPLTSFSPGGRSWGVRQPSKQARPFSSWGGLQDVLLAWTKTKTNKKKKAFVSWKNSTSILKLYLLRALGHAFPSGLWLHSLQEGEGCRLQGWAAGMPVPQLLKSRGLGCFVACRAQRLPSFICSAGSDLGPWPDYFPRSILASLPSIFLTAAKAVFFVKHKIRPSPSPA